METEFRSEIGFENASKSTENPKVSNLEPELPIAKEDMYTTVNKEYMKNFQKRLKELTEENQQLRKQIQDIVKVVKRKEDTLHAKLQLEITQLEAETRNEVKSLTDHIQILVQDKGALNDQIDVLHQERKELQFQCESLNARTKSMMSSDFHNKRIAEYKKLLNEAKKEHERKIMEGRQQYRILEESQLLLLEQVNNLKEGLNSSHIKIKFLENSNQEFLQEKTDMLQHMEEYKSLEQDSQKLLLSLLKVTENIAVERDILLNKISFQDDQQKELQTTFVGYSLNIGRLLEHMSGTSS